MPRIGNEFNDATTLVTGASRGIGRAIALDLAEHGANVIGTATSVEGILSIDSMFAQEDLEGHGAILDLGQHDEIKVRIQNIVEIAGKPISILINNAGITRDELALGMKDGWDDVIGVNLTGTFRVTQAVLRGMARARDGRVVTIGSVVGTVGGAGQVNYAAAKAGLVGMTKALAQEYGVSRNLKFNVLAPGLVDTEMTQVLSEERVSEWIKSIPLGRAYTTKEVAKAVRDILLSNKNGQLIAFYGGITSANE